MFSKRESQLLKSLYTVIILLIVFSAGYFFSFEYGNKSRPSYVDATSELIPIDIYNEDVEIDTPTLKRKYPDFIKSVYAPDPASFENILLKRSELPVDGVNTIRVMIRPLQSDRFYINAIKILKSEGFAVEVDVNGRNALKWAKIAEDLKVEYFSPLEVTVSTMKTDDYVSQMSDAFFVKKLVNDIRGVYSGRIVGSVYYFSPQALDGYSLEPFDIARVYFYFEFNRDTPDLWSFKVDEAYKTHFKEKQNNDGIKIVHSMNIAFEYRKKDLIGDKLKAYGGGFGGIDSSFVIFPIDGKEAFERIFRSPVSSRDASFFDGYQQKYDVILGSTKKDIVALSPKAENLINGEIEILGKFISDGQERVFVSIEGNDGNIVMPSTDIGTFRGDGDWMPFSGRVEVPSYDDSRFGIINVFLGDPETDGLPYDSVPVFFY